MKWNEDEDDDDDSKATSRQIDVDDRINALIEQWQKKNEVKDDEEIEDEERALTLTEEESEIAYKMALAKHFQRCPEMGEYYREMFWKGRTPDSLKATKPRRPANLKPKKLF